MTSESIEMAELVDRFPADLRKKLLCSTKSVAAIYAAAWPGCDKPLVRVKLSDPREPIGKPDNVVQLFERRCSG